jgi:hypothetical protein
MPAAFSLLSGIAIVSLVVSIALGQDTSQRPATAKIIAKGRYPQIIERAIDAAGTRFRNPGKERWTATVDLSSGAGATVIKGGSITMEWPGRLVLNAEGSTAVFRPDSAVQGKTSDATLDLAEVLLEDTLDGFLAATQNQGAVRTVGTGYPDPTRPGQTADVVALMMPSRAKSVGRTVAKMYWFDSKTRLLARVTRTDGVETRFSDWKEYQGDQYPGAIQVLEGKAVKYRIALAPQAVGAKQADGAFDPSAGRE